MLRKINPWLLVFLAAALFVLSWPPLPFPFLVFLAPVALLLLEDHHFHVADRPLQYYFQISVALTLWNAGTTWWTWFASPVGALLAILLNAQFQSLPWVLFHRTRKLFGDKWAYPALFAMVISVEFLHFNWDIAWPWLNLGNIFAGTPWAVQWYSITGILGGTLWILLVAFILFRLVTRAEKRGLSIGLVLLLALPLLFSFYLSNRYKAEAAKVKVDTSEVIVVQPNIDPYTDKFGGMTPEEQLQRLFHLTDSLVNEKTALVLWPETALTSTIVENNMEGDPTVQRIQHWIEQHPHVFLVSGASTVHFFAPGEEHSSTARKTPYDENLYYDAYNTALGFSAGKKVLVYHKAKLVPGVEKMPYPFLFGFLEHLAIDLGGTSGSLGTSDSAVVFEQNGLKVAPIICYESVFGEYVGEYVRNGATVLAVVTNDGWWKDTPGYKQHQLYAQLRAIENRMYVCRSANTGISGFIDPLGNSMSKSEWWVPAVMSSQVQVKGSTTFYARYGDYIGRIAAVIAVLILVAGFVRAKSRRRW